MFGSNFVSHFSHPVIVGMESRLVLSNCAANNQFVGTLPTEMGLLTSLTGFSLCKFCRGEAFLGLHVWIEFCLTL